MAKSGLNTIYLAGFIHFKKCYADTIHLPSALSVTVGMQQTAYTVGEVDDYQLVCFKVLSGDLDNREIVFDYTTTSGTACEHNYSYHDY